MPGAKDSDVNMDMGHDYGNDSNIDIEQHNYESKANEALLPEHLSGDDDENIQWRQDIDEHFDEEEDDYGYHEEYDRIDEENVVHEVDLDDTNNEVNEDEEGYRSDLGWEPPLLPSHPLIISILSGMTSLLRSILMNLLVHRSREPTHPRLFMSSTIDWEVACWAKLHGPGSTAILDLLNIDGVVDQLGLSYKNSHELNAKIDTLSGRPQFQWKEIIIGGTAFDVYFRDIMDCICALWQNPEFAPHLTFTPVRHYTDEMKTMQIYSNMNTGQW
ncbi:hypothetical protein EW146_g3488 [Bondarzewia mesenterica]|uniref:Uncharacterized protein n=1 Tax=Bondarzewia mesenterica TaxID=1095465 RepID=A0A4S4LXN4_9AGAM|nr:hypothetical protein EW146_g3488 [Bondarzewia mesenterica]